MGLTFFFQDGTAKQRTVPGGATPTAAVERPPDPDAERQRLELPCWTLTGLATIGAYLSVLGASSEDRPVASTHSVTRWLEQLKQGDRQAVQPLWERYFTRLVHLARIRHLWEKELMP